MPESPRADRRSASPPGKRRARPGRTGNSRRAKPVALDPRRGGHIVTSCRRPVDGSGRPSTVSSATPSSGTRAHGGSGLRVWNPTTRRQPALRELGSRFRPGHLPARGTPAWPLEHRDPSREVERLLPGSRATPGCASSVVRNACCASRSVVLVRLADVEHGDELAALVGERKHDRPTAPSRRPGRREAPTAGRSRVASCRGTPDSWSLVAHEALERRQRTAGDHVQVGELARGQRHDLERRRRRAVHPSGRRACRRAAINLVSVATLILGPLRGSDRALRGARG